MRDINKRIRSAEAYLIMHGSAEGAIEHLRALLAASESIKSGYIAENELLRKRVSELEQALSQAGDNIELQEAEQRGYARGHAAREIG